MTRLLLAGVVAVLAVGCGAGSTLPEGEPMPAGVVEQSLAEWQAQGLPAGDCQDWLLRVQWHTRDELPEVCHAAPGHRPLGCYTGSDGYGVVFAMPEDAVTVQHELRHWLGQCSGIGLDLGHEDDRLWYGNVR